MNIVKRIFLYLITNLLIIATISLVTNALGLHGYLTPHGIDYQALGILCFVWGMSGSFIALLLSRWVAKIAMSVKLIDPSTHVQKERELIQTVYHFGRRLGLDKMPEVGIYKANDLNAFATGPTKNRALIAVSSGLLERMNLDEIEGVLAHEMSHVVNGDMVTMTLLQGLVNTFSLFLSRLVAYTLNELWSRRSQDRSHRSAFFYGALAFLFDIFITLLGSIVVASFSRYREYRADKGGMHLVGRQKMISALEHLRTTVMTKEDADVVAPLKIHHKKNRFLSLLASHPDIDLRIAALKGSR